MMAMCFWQVQYVQMPSRPPHADMAFFFHFLWMDDGSLFYTHGEKKIVACVEYDNCVFTYAEMCAFFMLCVDDDIACVCDVM